MSHLNFSMPIVVFWKKKLQKLEQVLQQQCQTYTGNFFIEMLYTLLIPRRESLSLRSVVIFTCDTQTHAGPVNRD